jgi:hypothetical protein
MNVLKRLQNKRLGRWLGRWATQAAGHSAAAAIQSVGQSLRRAPAYDADDHLGGRHSSSGLADRCRRHLLFAFCDHYEPLWGRVSDSIGNARVRAWVDGYPRLASEFRDADGRPPRHTFFFPGEEYRPAWLDALGGIARQGFGEVELHLHHDGDDSRALRERLHEYLSSYQSHGHLCRSGAKEVRYGFIHGNWCLANSRPDGRWCGVDDELEVLFQTGCYADFTFPSAPDATQPGIVNEIYWPEGDLARARAHERGRRARVGQIRHDRILMIQGPLALTRRGGGLGVRIENGAITAHDPATPERVKNWVAQSIHVRGRPDWVFVKVHTHGAPERQAAELLGAGGRELHRALARYNDGKNWALHYVSAREMFNVALAAMAGCKGNPRDYLDFLLPPPPVCT